MWRKITAFVVNLCIKHTKWTFKFSELFIIDDDLEHKQCEHSKMYMSHSNVFLGGAFECDRCTLDNQQFSANTYILSLATLPWGLHSVCLTLERVLKLQHLVDEPRLLLQLSLVFRITCSTDTEQGQDRDRTQKGTLTQTCCNWVTFERITAHTHHHLSSWWSTRLPFWNAGLRLFRTLHHPKT